MRSAITMPTKAVGIRSAAPSTTTAPVVLPVVVDPVVVPVVIGHRSGKAEVTKNRVWNGRYQRWYG